MDGDKAQGLDANRALLTGPLRALVLELWQETRLDWGFVTDRLAAEFRRRRLGSHERRQVAEALYGMVRHARRIDEALASGGLKPSARAPDGERLLAYLVLEGGLPPAVAAEFSPALDWARVAAIDVLIAREKNPARRLARAASWPDFLAAELVQDHGDEAEPLALALNQRAPMTIRANTLMTDAAGLVARLAAEGVTARVGELCATAVVVEGRTNLFGLASFQAGAFEAQDEASQLVAELVAPPPRGVVVDFCAGAGGKTLAIAAAMANHGRVLACDVDARKLGELKRRARRAQVTTIQAVTLPPAALSALPPPLARIEGKADRVLVDAPCTGVGALRRNPEARYRLSPRDLEQLPVQQLAIAERALALVAPGGRLIYATCTVLAAENRRVIARLCERHPELEAVPVKEIWGKERAARVADPSLTYLELLPHRHGTDGFFAAVLRRR